MSKQLTPDRNGNLKMTINSKIKKLLFQFYVTFGIFFFMFGVFVMLRDVDWGLVEMNVEDGFSWLKDRAQEGWLLAGVLFLWPFIVRN